MVSRGGKLTYRWNGTAHLPQLLDMLYADALTGNQRTSAPHINAGTLRF